MLAYNKGQMIVPTGGGKTLTMIVDTQRRHDVINNGTTTVVVLCILLAEQLCSEFMEVIDHNNSDHYLHVMHVTVVKLITLAQLKQTKFICMQTVLALWVRMLSSSPLTILFIVLWRQILRSTRSTLTKHITV